jgi:hypothetical protein
MPARFFPQERERTCMVAALRSVLATQFDVHVREDVLRFAGDDALEPIVRVGSGTHQLRLMVEVADRAVNIGPRWKLKVRTKASIRDIAREVRAGRYPIASVLLAPGKMEHCVVVCGYEPGRVSYFDPADGKTRTLKSGQFRAIWNIEDTRWLASVVTS